MQDEQWIQQVLAGNDDAFRSLVETHREYLYQAIYGVLHHPKNSEDVLQEVWVRIYVSLPQFQGDGFKTWITRIAVNRAIDYRRKLQRSREELLEQMDEQRMSVAAESEMGEASSAERCYFSSERKLRIQQKLFDLPQVYRQVVIAYYLEEKSYKEIAAELGVAVKTVESNLYRAKQWIRQHWKEEEFL
ncbi:RNA polymerase sigma factor [Paenibacillus sp. y28]|uniref:RNA polymerase sigma factor n=1 Tax=Paenibacillus sp. y28 TaxID=3129110 RepID=UPI003019095A